MYINNISPKVNLRFISSNYFGARRKPWLTTDKKRRSAN